MQFGFSNPFVAILAAIVVAAAIVYWVFPNEVNAFLNRIGGRPAKDVRARSDARLAEMDRNVAERKAQRSR